jgi:predicted Zn-dependent peptidase
MVGTGSRDERLHESGMAHFIEHMIFKGTKKRKAFHVLGMIENSGGELNAFTTKEETCVYASFLSPFYEKSIELFADVAFNSIFPVKEMQKEKMVILDEINSYLDNPAEQIFDDFESLVFQGHPLGNNILGTEKTVNSFKKTDVFRFMKRNYRLDNIVISSVGDISLKKLIALTEKYFESVNLQGNIKYRQIFNAYIPKREVNQNGSYLSHIMIGNVAYKRTDSKRLPLLLLNNLLGGPALNSRLNLNLREKHGLAYSVESMYNTYSDTGLFAVYLGTDLSKVEKSIGLVMKELKLLREKKLGSLQLAVAKKQIAGQLAIQYDSRQNEMLSIAKSLLYKPKLKSIESFLKEIDELDAISLMEVANEVFDEQQLSTLIFEAKEND